MKILILGGTGIISESVTSQAVKEGHDVTILNRGMHESNLKVKVIHADMKMDDVLSIKKKINDVKYDCIIDFISYNSMQLEKILSSLRNLFDQYIFISTASIYGGTGKNIIDEKSSIYDAAKWGYIKNKIKCERYLISDSQSLGYCYTIIRPYITFSNKRIPMQFSPLSYYTVIDRMKNNLPVLMFNEESTCAILRSEDFATACVGLIGNHKSFNEDFIITSDNSLKWSVIYEELLKLTKSKSELVILPPNEILTLKGVDRYEIIDDKAGIHQFNIQKITDAVPMFKPTSKDDLTKSIKQAFCDYIKNKTNDDVDYFWNGRVDLLLYKNGFNVKWEDYNEVDNNRRKRYQRARNNLLFMTDRFVSKIGNKH